ncbi:MAG: division/cell wall cluster transcriptional repressor MraZ [Planctomycetota bacterium]
MLLGEFIHGLEESGRLTVPSKLRPLLGDQLIMTKGHDRCLYLFGQTEWGREAERVRVLPRSERKNRSVLRAFFPAAVSVSLDSHNRITIPPALRDYAHLSREVAVLGVLDRVEIWDASRWRSFSAAADAEYSGEDPCPER